MSLKIAAKTRRKINWKIQMPMLILVILGHEWRNVIASTLS